MLLSIIIFAYIIGFSPCVLGQKNILFIMSDDLRPQINAWTGPDFPTSVSPQMITPNLDALASRSLVLTRAYSQYPVCSPSRTSFMTGRRPDTTKIYDLETHWRDAGGNFTSMPQYFKEEHGYVTISSGKSFHLGESTADPPSWSESPYGGGNSFWNAKNNSWIAVAPDIAAIEPLPDVQIKDYALESLRRLAPAAFTGEQPFFVFAGFKKPHLPLNCPEEFYDYYPTEDINFPPFPFAPTNMPTVAWANTGEIQAFHDIAATNYSAQFNETLDPIKTLEVRRAYYACVSFIDSLVGELIQELEILGLSDSTIVAFAGDHGFHLGELARWTKHMNFELAAHVPMMIHIPGVTDNGTVSRSLVELVDFFPTLLDAAGLPPVPVCPEDSTDVPVCTEGRSLVPLVQNPNDGKIAAFSQRRKGQTVMGYSVRTDSYRYNEWPAFIQVSEDPPEYEVDWDDIRAYELYDHSLYPEEHINVVDEPGYESIREELSQILRAGWRNATNSHIDYKL